MTSRVALAVLIGLLSGCGGQTQPAAPATTGDRLGSTTPPATSSVETTTSAAPSGPADSTVRDGEPWLVYGWFAEGKQTRDVFLVRPDGTGRHVILGELPGVHWSPAWSPDGRQIVFAVTDESTPNGSIWTAGADGSGASRLTDGAGACPDGMAHPAWSPDGAKVAFICYPDPGGRQGSVAVFDVATGKITRLTTVRWPEHLDSAPTWSPDGRSIAYSVLHWDPTDQFITGSLIGIVPAAGGKERRLGDFDSNLTDPDWSPDGSWLATFTYDMGNMHTTPHPSNLYLVHPDGTGLTQVTRSSVDGNMRIVAPRWTPDGTRLVCAVGFSLGSNFTTDDLRLAFVDPAGGEPDLLDPVIHGSQPDLRPTP